MGIMMCVILLAVMTADTKKYFETTTWENVKIL